MKVWIDACSSKTLDQLNEGIKGGFSLEKHNNFYHGKMYCFYEITSVLFKQNHPRALNCSFFFQTCIMLILQAKLAEPKDVVLSCEL